MHFQHRTSLPEKKLVPNQNDENNGNRIATLHLGLTVAPKRNLRHHKNQWLCVAATGLRSCRIPCRVIAAVIYFLPPKSEHKVPPERLPKIYPNAYADNKWPWMVSSQSKSGFPTTVEVNTASALKKSGLSFLFPILALILPWHVDSYSSTSNPFGMWYLFISTIMMF